jgi:molybdopterin-guanine dinucleotide biosynthesis protein
LLVEGFKHTPIPKLEVYRPSVGKPLLAGENTEGIVAVATDEPAQVTQLLAQNTSKNASADAARQATLPVLLLDEPALIADFILRYLEL